MIRRPGSCSSSRPSAAPPLARRLATGLLLAALSVPSACGWAEWPPPGRIAPAAPPPVRLVTPTKAPAAVVVQSGDSVFNLARRYNVSVRAIIEANNLQPPYVLQGGQRIALPRAIEHEVKRGDTLYGISRQYGTDSFGIARLNGLEPPYLLQPGQRLQIPVASANAASEQASQPRAAAASDNRASPVSPAIEQVGITPLQAPGGPAQSPPITETAMPAPQPRPATPEAEPSPAPAALSGAQAPLGGGTDARSRTATFAPPSAVSSSGFSWPVRGRIASTFGTKARGLHNDGINVLAPRGAPVIAVHDGVVAYAGSELKGFGNLLLVKHDDGWVSAYGHNDELLVKPGEKVRRGQIIARVGSTGNVTKPQLHFELRRGRKAFDPIDHLPKDA